MWGRWKASFRTSYLILNLEEKKIQPTLIWSPLFQACSYWQCSFFSFFLLHQHACCESQPPFWHWWRNRWLLQFKLCGDQGPLAVCSNETSGYLLRDGGQSGPNCPLTCGAAWEEVGMLSQAWGGYPDFRVSLIWVEAKCWTYVQFSAYSKRDDSLAQK